jgi:ATP-dependent RNA helicase RhlE
MSTSDPSASDPSESSTADDGRPSFAGLALCRPLKRALKELGYEHPTPIQTQAIPYLLEDRDLLGVAQTGTGKTAAFALPLLNRMSNNPKPLAPKRPRALVLTPTRELAAQIEKSFEAYGRYVDVTSCVIFGGVSQVPQVRALRKGVDVVVATPGRLLDLISQREIDLRRIEFFVLDEADRMLDMGFVRDVQKVLEILPPRRQSLLFSATMPDDIVKLARSFLHDPVRVEVTPPATTVERIDQLLYYVEKGNKRHLLSHILKDHSIKQVLVFSRTKHGADRIVKHLRGDVASAAAIHGNKSQGQRERALQGFREGTTRVLVATDIAARGIDVPGITHVINFDLPNIPDSYVHRIGRTARAGRDGVAMSFCDVDEREYLKDIEKLTRQRLEVVEDHPYVSDIPLGTRSTKAASTRGRGGGGGGRSSGGSGGRGGRGGRSTGGGQRSGGAAKAPAPGRRRRRGGGSGGGSGGGRSRSE